MGGDVEAVAVVDRLDERGEELLGVAPVDDVRGDSSHECPVARKAADESAEPAEP
jgi:hypothetical protein